MSLLSILHKESGAEILKILRAPEFMTPTIAFPVLFYSVFGVMMGGGGSQAKYMLATFGVFAVMGPALFNFGVGVSMEKDRGWLDLKRVSPMPIWIYLIAKMIAALFAAFLTLCLLFAVARFAGGVAMPLAQWGQLLLIQLCISLPFSLLGMALGFSIKGNGAVGITNILYLGMSVVGGLFMPTSMFPTWFQAIGEYLPSFHAGRAALSVLGMTGDGVLHHLVILGGFTLGFGVLAWLSWGLQKK